MKSLLLFLLFLVLVGCTASPTVITDEASSIVIPTIDPSDTELLATKRKYELLCAHCHGYEGAGQPTGSGPGTVERTLELGFHTVPRHDAEGHTWQHPSQLLFEIIKDGAESPLYLYDMSPHGSRLDDDEIWDIIEYIKRFWTDEQREHQAQLTARYAENQPNWELYHLDIYADDLNQE